MSEPRSVARPEDETQRVAELLSLGLLDTGREERFDRYTRLTADVFEVPVAYISLLGAERQWLKSAVGWQAAEIDRDTALCSHTVLSDAPLVIPDTTQDERFADNPLVTGPPGFRFYAGAPLHGPGGHSVGTLAIADYRPRRLDAHGRWRLRAFAELVEQELRHDGTPDLHRLADLPNQRLLRDRLDQALDAAGEHGRVILMLVSLNQLRAVTGALGWEAADAVVYEAVQRLADAVPRTATVSRWRDDEFAVILPHAGSESELKDSVRAVMQAFEAPFQAGARSFFLTVRIGVAVYPGDGSDADELLGAAAAVVKAERREARSTYRFYRRELDEETRRRFELERRLREAIETGALEIAWQPQIEIGGNRVAGMEALVRWRDPELGEVAADELVPVAERSGLILPLGRAMLHAACRQHRRWQDAGLDPPPAAVNLASAELRQDRFPEQLREVLTASGIDGASLQLEVTESTLIEDVDVAVKRMNAIRELGVGISVDDFGTGYSSLSYLIHLPLTELKIDRSFIREIDRAAGAASVARAIVGLAHGLGLRVVAEGVETQAQLDFLRGCGCELAQGFLFSRPLSADGMARLLSADGRPVPGTPPGGG